MPDIPTSAIASAATAASRIQPWRTVRRHDRLVLEEYEDLNTWAHDDLQDEARALEAVKNDLAARGMIRSGAYAAGMNRVRDDFAKRWRDRKRAADRRLAELREAEGVTVKAWRKIKRKPWPRNPDGENLQMIVRGWESEDVRRESVRREVEGFRTSSRHVRAPVRKPARPRTPRR